MQNAYSTVYPYKSSHDVIGPNEVRQSTTTNSWNQLIEETARTLLIAGKIHTTRKQEEEEAWEQIKKNRQRSISLKGGGKENEVKLPIVLNNLKFKQTVEEYDRSEEEVCNAIIADRTVEGDNYKGLRFIQLLAPNINVDADENNKVLFRRNDYGLALTYEELERCITMVSESRSMEDIFNEIRIQAMYRHCNEEFKGTEGSGFCSILAMVGTLSPQLNSTDIMNNKQRREEIANAIEDILIPSVRDYSQPAEFRMNTNAHEHDHPSHRASTDREARLGKIF
jgi:hypothetical protein